MTTRLIQEKLTGAGVHPDKCYSFDELEMRMQVFTSDQMKDLRERLAKKYNQNTLSKTKSHFHYASVTV